MANPRFLYDKPDERQIYLIIQRENRMKYYIKSIEKQMEKTQKP